MGRVDFRGCVETIKRVWCGTGRGKSYSGFEIYHGTTPLPGMEDDAEVLVVHGSGPCDRRFPYIAIIWLDGTPVPKLAYVRDGLGLDLIADICEAVKMDWMPQTRH